MHKPKDVAVITIDGPSGAGKGTISRIVAKKLGFHYLDSGALYRLLGLCSQRHHVSVTNVKSLAALAEHMDVEFKTTKSGEFTILLEGEDVKTAIMKASKLTPSDHSLKSGERWCMMDSGAGCNAANRQKEFPKYQIKNGSKKRQCVLADGTEIRSEGVVWR